jgi:hypothetical protein
VRLEALLPPREVELRLFPGHDDETVLELEHALVARLVEIDGRQVDPILNDAETGTWAWEPAGRWGFALDMFLRAETFEARPEIAQLADRCGQAWAAAVEAASTA